jgi:phosphate transport system permease protein
VRAFAKPLLEVLAGIPTIVYGLFALLTVGRLLMRSSATAGSRLDAGGTAVMTAGLVMGIMLIPFVSRCRTTSSTRCRRRCATARYGLGATQSETVRQVILPAALPGIVGAILLAASRAIGETMIVVLGAGAAARLSLNPFEAMTTVTAKIVSQLTGDADFASPEALVAFALGMTLFVITLGLNVSRSTSCANTGSSTNDRRDPPADPRRVPARNGSLLATTRAPARNAAEAGSRPMA